MPSFAAPRVVLVAGLMVGLAITWAVVAQFAHDVGVVVPSGPDVAAPAGDLAPPPTPPGNAVSEAARGTAERVVRAAGLAVLCGRLLDSAGVPIGGLPIELDDGKPRLADANFFSISRGTPTAVGPRDRRITGADGTFDFADLVPGTYSLRSGAFVPSDAQCTLAAGERAFVELRLPSSFVFVTGRVLLAGVPAAEAMVSIVPAATPDADGTACNAGEAVQILLRPGRYELHTWSHRLGPDVVFARQALLVPDDRARVAFAMAFGGTPVEVVVRGECAFGRDVLGIDVNGTAADHAGARYTAYESRVGGTTRFLLPAGTWRVTVSGPGIAWLPERVCAIDADTPPIRIEHEARPGAVVRLDLTDARGEPVWVAPELLPPLFAQGGSCACTALEERARARPVGYRFVPLGPALLQWEDRFENGARTFLPFDPLPPLDLVVGAEGTVVPLVVLRRPWVDLRACDRTGREDCYAKIAVFAGPERVRGRDEEAPQRWSGWLPPGDYRVVVERSTGASERLVTVGRSDLALRLRP